MSAKSILTPQASDPWISAYLYCQSGNADNILLESILPLLKQVKAVFQLHNFFFIRYADSIGHHIRLRFKLHDSTDKLSLINYLLEKNSALSFHIYQPELERYGGENGISECENYFHHSSLTVLNLLKKYKGLAYPNKIVLGLQMHYLALESISFLNIETKLLFLKKYAALWLPNMPDVNNIREIYGRLEHSYQFIKGKLEVAIKTVVADGNHYRGEMKNWARQTRSLSMRLFDLEKKGELNSGRYQYFETQALNVFISLFHMTNNRIGIENNDEGYIAYLLYRYYQDG